MSFGFAETKVVWNKLGRISKGMPAQEDAMTDKTETPELPAAAQRALAEAEERRKKAKDIALPKELGGREGPEPVRYGDWENKGLAIDF